MSRTLTNFLRFYCSQRSPSPVNEGLCLFPHLSVGKLVSELKIKKNRKYYSVIRVKM